MALNITHVPSKKSVTQVLKGTWVIFCAKIVKETFKALGLLTTWGYLIYSDYDRRHRYLQHPPRNVRVD